MTRNELAEKLVKQCLASGADAAEVYVENQRNLRIRIRNSETETIVEAAQRGVGFRVFVQGKMAFSFCNDFSREALNKAVTSAIRFARHTTPDKHNILPDQKGQSKVEGLFDPRIKEIPMGEKIDLAKKLEKLALKDSRITKSAGASFSEGDGETVIANSNGLNKGYQSSYCSLGVSVVAEKGDQKFSGGEYCTRRAFKGLKPLEEIALKAARDAYERLDPRMVKTQRAPVIFHPDAARSVLGGILRAINGERVLQGASFLAKRLNKPVSSPLVTLIDDGTIKGGIGSRPFDGEGVPTQKRVIIEKGILKGFMYNTITAARAGLKSTGNASRGGFRSVIGIGSHNFYMAAGTHTPEDIIKKVKNGLLLKGVTGYGINPVSGHFSGGASGFWIKDGKIAFPVRGLTVAGDAFKMLKDIEMIGNDLDLSRTLTAPTFLIRELQIGGE